jgi:uncharacterized protein
MFDQLFNKKKSLIYLAEVNLGIKKVKVPVAQIRGKENGPSILITAGADGDEYASIEAAYKLIELFKSGNFKGLMTVIPILNIPGFEDIKSINPLDFKYPKYIFPGDKNGSASEKLIYWLDHNFIQGSSLWLDMHGGAIDEKLDPYLYFYETENQKLAKIIKSITSKIEAKKIVFERKNIWKKAVLLSKQSIVYILAEAGCSGERKIENVQIHIRWAKIIMGALGMIEYFPGKRKLNPRIYSSFDCIKAKISGLWFPVIPENALVKSRQKLGEIRSYDGIIRQVVFSNHKGECLYWKEGLSCMKNDILVEIGYS